MMYFWYYYEQFNQSVANFSPIIKHKQKVVIDFGKCINYRYYRFRRGKPS